MQFLFQTPALHLHQPPVTHSVNSQPTRTRFSSGALTAVSISLRKKILVKQKVKGKQLLARREKWAPANSASCSSSYCSPYISFSFVIALEALQLSIQKIQQCWGSHHLHFGHSSTSLPRHARTFSCSLWPVLLSQQKPKLCFRRWSAFPLLLWETENIILLNKRFCKCCPADLCGTFTGECFAQHGVHQHSQPHAGLSWRRQAFKLKTSSCSQTWGTWDRCQYKERHPEQLTRMTSPTLLWQQWHFSREHRHFASPLFTQPFCSCMCQGRGRKKRSQHLSSKPPRAKPEEHTAKPFGHRPWCFCKEQITPAERLPAKQPDTCCSLSHPPSVPVPTVPSKASCQPDQTCKDGFVLYSRGWHFGRIWTEETGLHC